MNYILIDKVPQPEPDLMKWALWFQIANRIVKKETINGCEISTVFLGIDSGFGGRPMLFETMIFGGEHDEFQERYSTWEEAEEGHKRACDMVSFVSHDN